MVVTLARDSVSLLGAVCTGFLIFGMVACSGSPEKEAPEGRPAPANSSSALLDVFGSHTDTVILGNADGTGQQIVLAPELSARVIGTSIDGLSDENLMWVDKTIMEGTYFQSKPYFWNAGGLRTWLAPEDLFFVNAGKDPESWFVPEQLDPISFEVVSKSSTEAVFRADIDLPANIGKTYAVTIERRIGLLKQPPAEIGSLPAGVEYVGVAKTHSLTNRSDLVIGDDLPYVCLWSLLQINPSGTTLVPIRPGYDPQKAYREYFNPLGDRLVVRNGIISIRIDGRYRLKIGVRPEAAGKGLAYLRDDGDGTGVLFVKVFPIEADGIYVDKPWGKESDYGDVIELYNDDGKMGGFTEIECHGPAKRIGKGETQSHSLTLHIFRGPLPELKNIGSALLDADLNAAKYF